MNKGTSTNCLSQEQFYKLSKVLERDRLALETKPGTMNTYSTKYSKELGFTVTIANVSSALKVMGIKKKRERTGVTNPYTLFKDTLSSLKTRIEDLESYNNLLTEEIAELKKRIG